MPVATTQIVEIYEIVRGYVGAYDRMSQLLYDLQHVEATDRNSSFRRTVYRLVDCHLDNAPSDANKTWMRKLREEAQRHGY